MFICCRFTSCKAFKKVMGEVTDLAGQHEVIAENLQSDVIREITCLVKDFKEERKKVSGRMLFTDVNLYFGLNGVLWSSCGSE